MSFASSFSFPRVFGESQDGDLGRPAALKNGALSAPSSKRVGAGSVEEELAVRPRWPLPFVVPSFDAPNPLSYKGCHHGPPIELRMVGRHWVNPGPISHEWSAWCKPHIRRPVLARSSSLDVGPPTPCTGNTPRRVSVGEDDRLHIGRLQFPGVEDLEYQFDDTLVQSYAYPGSGRRLFPSGTPLYNKFVGRVPAINLGGLSSSVCLRNRMIGGPAIADRLHVGEAVRFESRTSIHNLEGRKTNTWCSTKRVVGGHYQGRNYFAPGCTYNPPLPQHCRIVCIDACKFRWCSVDSVAFHSFAWPRHVKEAKGIARMLYANHCNWVDVLIVRGSLL